MLVRDAYLVHFECSDRGLKKSEYLSRSDDHEPPGLLAAVSNDAAL